MKIFKFGGASVKDAAGIKNVYEVIQLVGHENVLVIVSAMGKTTNAFESVLRYYFENDTTWSTELEGIKQHHLLVIHDLFEDKNDPIFSAIDGIFNHIQHFLSENKSANYNFVYDQVVSQGELISSLILSSYIAYRGLASQYLDVRTCIQTDDNYREGLVDWAQTEHNISNLNLDSKLLYVTQGFIGIDENGFTTTLGREGSDYTAAIFAYCLNAESVTIWKDVPGVMNADPRHFENATLLNQISYREAIELAFYGATVIHPKTLQPLQKKEIPLFVKSFLAPELPGTKVSNGPNLTPQLPCFIIKKEQLLVSLSSIDFSFIVEENISTIFKLLHDFKMKVSLIQNSAISFSVCIEDKYHLFEELKAALSKNFKVTYNENVALYTIRHFTDEAAQKVQENKTVLLKQISRETMQMVIK